MGDGKDERQPLLQNEIRTGFNTEGLNNENSETGNVRFCIAEFVNIFSDL